MTTIIDKVKLVVVHRDSPDVETELGIFPSKDAAMPRQSPSMIRFERQSSPLRPRRPQRIPLRINGLLDARAKAFGLMRLSTLERTPHFSRSFQFGRTSAPTMPHLVQTIRGPNSRTRRIAGILIDVEDHLVSAAVAHDQQRPDAVLAHVREVHRLDRWKDS
jgi:hypothetical protein